MLTPVLMPVLYTGEDFLSRVFEKLPGTESAFFIEHHWLHTHWGTPEPVLDLFCCPTDLWSTIDCLYRWSV